MTRQNQKGFTIIEVIIFTAITGSLLLIGLLGQGAIRDEARFTDSLETLEAQLEGIKTEAASTLNVSGSPAGTDASQVIFGSLISFTAGSGDVVVKTIGHENIEVNDGNYAPYVLDERTFDLRWGVTYDTICADPNPAPPTAGNENCTNPATSKDGCILFYRDIPTGQLEMATMSGSVCGASVGDQLAAEAMLTPALVINFDTAYSTADITNIKGVSGLRLTDGSRSALLLADTTRSGGSLELSRD